MYLVRAKPERSHAEGVQKRKKETCQAKGLAIFIIVLGLDLYKFNPKTISRAFENFNFH